MHLDLALMIKLVLVIQDSKKKRSRENEKIIMDFLFFCPPFGVHAPFILGEMLTSAINAQHSSRTVEEC